MKVKVSQYAGFAQLTLPAKWAFPHGAPPKNLPSPAFAQKLELPLSFPLPFTFDGPKQ